MPISPGTASTNQSSELMGLKIAELLNAMMPLFVLDQYVDDPLVMMACVPGDEPDPAVEADYLAAMAKHISTIPDITFIERFAFYERANKAFTVVLSGETRKYGNIILKKGVW